MRDHLNRECFPGNRKSVRRLKCLMWLEPAALKPNTSRRRKEQKVSPYLLKKMSIVDLDQVCRSGITYILLTHDFVYLGVVIGLGETL